MRGSSINNADTRMDGMHWSQGSGSSYQTPRREGEPSVHKGGNERPGQGWGGPRESRKYTGEGKPNQTKSFSQNSNVVCFGCKQTGHIKRECPSKQLNRIRSPTPSINNRHS